MNGRSKEIDIKVDAWKDILRNCQPYLNKKYAVRRLWPFGSYLRGEQHPESDLDVLVEFEKAPSLFKFVELEDLMQGLLGVKVNLVMKKSLRPRIGERILAEAVPV